jgi:RNA polymerase sigma factor (sigma-70 family)
MTEYRPDRVKTVPSPPVRDDKDAGPHKPDWTLLMARTQDGDAIAYARLLHEITPFIRSRAARYHRDPRDVEDTVQDILLTLHAVRHTYDPTRPFGPWLVGIANRRAFDRLRRQGRQHAYELPLTHEPEDITAAKEPPVSGDVEWKHLEGMIGSLPASQQTAIRLLKLREMSLKEASTETGLSIATLKVATHRALKSLRKMLAGKDDPS